MISKKALIELKKYLKQQLQLSLKKDKDHAKHMALEQEINRIDLMLELRDEMKQYEEDKKKQAREED